MPSIESPDYENSDSPLRISEDKNDRKHVTFKENEACNSKKNEDEMPLSFASFYYSLKVSKGKDEREDVQKKTFAKWINFQLAKVIMTIHDLSFFCNLTCF